MQLSSSLASFLGTQNIPRTEVTKLIWAYIKTNDLQNPQDKREILCDDRLEALFKRKKINMFKMTKALSLLMKKVDELQDGKQTKVKTPVVKSEKSVAEKKRKVSDERDNNQITNSSAAKKKEKKIKTEKDDAGAATKKPGKLYTLSPSLSALLGGRTEESRFKVSGLIWEHIKENNLQKESDKRMIVCDAKMKKVFGLDEVHMFTMNKLLSPHFLTK